MHTPQPLDILRGRLPPPRTPTPDSRPQTPQTPQSPLSPLSAMTLSDGLISALPTPPEPLLPAKQATVFFPNLVHPTALAYATERFGRVLGPETGEEGYVLADGIVNRQNKITGDILCSAPRLVGIAQVGVGVDSIDLAGCRERQIAVTNCPGANASAVAELTLALTLAVMRRIVSLDRRLRAGEVLQSLDHLGHGVRGKTVGVIGMGSTARCTAELFHTAFACPILVFSPTSPPTRWTAHDPSGALPHTRHTTLESLLESSDIICLHCPLTSQTRGLVGAAELAVMKRGSVLINMSRGAVVDERALCAALKSGETVRAAASDVFEHEPAEKSKMNGLLDLDNFVATPHMGGSTVEAQVDVCLQAIDQLADIFDGRQVLNRVC